MTAIYTEERPNIPAPFHLDAAANAAVYSAESNAWESAEGEKRYREHVESPWTPLEASTHESCAALNTTPRAALDEDLWTASPIEFSQPCEEEFARMLDARDVSWQYKPRTFAVEWDDEGNFVDCFTPDFYLPANEMYIALIAPVCNESNAKSRKVKMLRSQHPEIRIELLSSRTCRTIQRNLREW